ncbi:hypothetical protein [Streptomyces sp. NPDC001642]|uniref:hypothetical protein n=1 Tax=Streptomyces sp. NPDC001642 TaxID=3154392 RepID=UPI0033184EA1
MDLHMHLSPELQGAVVGALAAILAGAIGGWGAKVQAKAALEAVRMEARRQRHEANWQVRRDAYAAFFASVEEARTAVAHVRAVRVTNLQHPEQEGYNIFEARTALTEALRKVWFQQSLLRLAVPPLTQAGHDGVLEQLRSLVTDMDAWLDATFRGDERTASLEEALERRAGDVDEVVRRVTEEVRVYLESAPVVDPPTRSWRRRNG